MDKILDTFLLTYRTTPNSTLPKQQSPAEMFLGRKPRTTLDLLLPTKQLSGHDKKMERQFNRRHGAVARKFEVGDPVQVRYRHSQDWKAATVTKQIGGRLYDITLTDGSRWRSHVNQMRLRHIHHTADYLVDFFDGFNLPAPRTHVYRGKLDRRGSRQQIPSQRSAARNPQGLTTRWNHQVRCQWSLVSPNEAIFQKGVLNWTQT